VGGGQCDTLRIYPIDRNINTALGVSEAWCATKVRRPADDALVNSIKKAATKPGTSWSTIMPAITGPGTPEHYLSGTDSTLKTRHEFKKATQASLFWKKTAKDNPAYKNTIMPSSSNLSDLFSQIVCGSQHHSFFCGKSLPACKCVCIVTNRIDRCLCSVSKTDDGAGTSVCGDLRKGVDHR
jgi:hypothetical protein